MSVQIKFSASVPAGDPESRPVTIVGKKPNLTKVPFADVAPFLGTRVTEEVANTCMGCLQQRKYFLVGMEQACATLITVAHS